MSNAIKVAAVEFIRKRIEGNMGRMFPDLGAMNEQEVKHLVDKLRALRGIYKCPYSRRKFEGDVVRYVVYDSITETFRVGVVEFIMRRALLDEVPYELCEEIFLALQKTYTELREARETEEAAAAAVAESAAKEVQRRQGLIDMVAGEASYLKGLHPTEDTTATPQAFDDQLRKLTGAMKLPEEAVELYFADREKRRAEEAVRAQAAVTEAPAPTAAPVVEPVPDSVDYSFEAIARRSVGAQISADDVDLDRIGFGEADEAHARP